MTQGNIFSESWFKVSDLRVSLNYSNYIRKQFYRDNEFYIIEDQYNNQFFKVSPEAYSFISKLTVNKQVNEVWEECMKTDPQKTPTQDEVISLLTSLHHKNLLYFKNKANIRQLYQRSKEKKFNETKSKLISFLYLKVPLFNPNNFLNAIEPFIKILFSKYSFILWIIVLILGGKNILENFTQLSDQSQGILAPSNLFLLYICIVFLKTFHEFGHAMMVKKYGGNVNTMGVMILILTPIPFMDATQSWTFRSKYQRALVGAAGMMVELFIASIAAIIWANTGDGLINSLAFNMMVIGSVSSLFFNGNPLLKFDAYYILSDILEVPNLYERSTKTMIYFAKKYILKMPIKQDINVTLKESFLFILYGVSSFIYRIIVAVVIALYVANQWLFIGFIVLVLFFYVWLIKPISLFLKFLYTDRYLQRNKIYYFNLLLLVFVLLALLFTKVPFPHSIKAKGILMSENYQDEYIQIDGLVKDILVENGKYVQKGDLLAILDNQDLLFEIKKIENMIEESKVNLIMSKYSAKADMTTIEKHIQVLQDKLDFLYSKKDKLLVKASNDGYFIDSYFKDKKFSWIKMGTKIGTIVSNDKSYFEGVVLQNELFGLFNSKGLDGEIKLYGLLNKTINTKSIKVIPYEQTRLPSPVLGWLGGGDIAVSNNDRSGINTKESFFEVRSGIIEDKNLKFFHGRSGILKIKMEPITLYERTYLYLKQILQKHYKL